MAKATETAIRAAIERGQADVLATRVTPHPTFVQLLRTGPSTDAGAPIGRAIVWSDAARDGLVAKFRKLKGGDAAAAFADAIDNAVRNLGRDPHGADGLVPHTYKMIVPGTPMVLAFELVTWTKAGEVIAILHLFEGARDAGREGPLWR